jgi:hypothetical protein
VLEWSKALLDSQLTRLAQLGARVEPLVERLAAAVSCQAAATSRLLPLKGVAEHMAANAPLPEAHVATASRYTVELLDLRVRQ